MPGKRRKYCLIFESDHHINNLVGLCPPDFAPYRPTRFQQELIKAYADFGDQCEALAEGREVAAFLVGDTSDADIKERTTDLISRNPGNILRMTHKVFERRRKLAKWLFVIRGTEAHVGQEAWFEEELGDLLGAEKTREGDRSWWRLQTDFFGPKLDVAHIVGRGIPALLRLIGQSISDYAALKERPADLLIRGHQHTYYDTYDAHPVTRAITLPCWQGPTGYIAGTKVTPLHPHIGGLVVLVTGQEIEEVRPIRYPFRKENEIWPNKST